MSGFGARLRERKLVQWGLAYLAGAWLTLQLLGLLGDQLGWPPAIFRYGLALLAVGLLAALVLAWFHGEKGEQRVGRIELAMFALLAVIAGAAVTLVRGKPEGAATAPVAATATDADRASLAVLPFTNLSSDPENAYFAGGIHDELLTQLAQIPGLKVISRTTMLRYEGSQKSIKEIAQELGVRAVMEGSVQRVGDRVRINAQLIDAATDEHLWAQRFDREILDVFAVQSEVAGAVATAMRTALSPRQAAALVGRPTEDAEAYALYLRGADYLGRGGSEQNLRNAERLLQAAVELDPSFAEAWAQLSRAQLFLYWFGLIPTEAQLAEGRRSAEQAYALAPDQPLVRSAMGEAYYRAREYERALEFVEPLLAEVPDFPGAAVIAAAIYRRQGRWDDALGLWERAVELDPGGADWRQNLGHTFRALHRFADAVDQYERAIALAPDEALGYLPLSVARLEWRGDLVGARGALGRMPASLASERELALVWLDAAEGRLDDALARLPMVTPGTRTSIEPAIGMPAADRALLAGVLLNRLGRAAEARARYREAADSLEAIVGAAGFDPRGQIGYLSALALAYAGLGQKDRAIATVERSARELPVSLDASFGPRRLVDKARIFAVVGERERAVAALREALSHTISATPYSLRLDPLLASLEGYEPFERLMREQEAR